MKIKKLNEEQTAEIAGVIDTEGFWDGLIEGYLVPKDVLEDSYDIIRVKEAVAILKEFQDNCPVY